MGESSTSSSPSLSDLPPDMLTAYGRDLGLSIEPGTPRGEVLRRIRERQELLLDLDRDALLDVVQWARIPVRRSAGKEQLAAHIASVTNMRFDGLSDRGLHAMARLRGIDAERACSRESIEKRLRRQEGFWTRVRRKRRQVVGSWLTRVIEGPRTKGDYQFLPEDDTARSLADSIEHEGVVGGIAHRLRGAADQYLKHKLDEIEERIDRKLDEIDGRLAEWRDREIRNRLRIVKITLIAAIVVALISLGYDYLKARSEASASATPPVVGSPSADPAP